MFILYATAVHLVFIKFSFLGNLCWRHPAYVKMEYKLPFFFCVLSGLEISQLKRLKELEEENAKLKKMYANLALDNEILREVIEKKL